MKYFTSELLERANQADIGRAAQAVMQWEERINAYKAHLSKLRPKLKGAVKRLSQVNFHDAHVIHLSTKDNNFNLLLREGNHLFLLVYALRDETKLISPSTTPAYAGDGLQWLYDELDETAQGFEQRVLLSDGSELVVPFDEVTLYLLEVRSHRVSPTDAAKKPKKNGNRSNAKAGEREAWMEFFQSPDVSILDMISPVHGPQRQSTQPHKKLASKK